MRCSVACNKENTVATASIYKKILWFVFYLVVFSSSTLSIIYVYLRPTLTISVFSY